MYSNFICRKRQERTKVNIMYEGRVISGTTKKGQSLLATARRYDGETLDDVYGRYSAAKSRAYNDCKRWCEEDNGYDFHICSHNCNFFTVAWNYTNPETGETMTRIETASNTYVVDGSR